MKIERRNSSDEKKILTAMVTDRAVLARISAHWERGRFRSPWSNLIGKWCIDYFRQYEKAPGQAIESIYESWSSTNPDKETSTLVGKFLSELSDNYERGSNGETNSEYIIDLAGKHFNKVKLSQLVEELEGDLDQGEVDQAQKRVTQFSKVELGEGSWIDVLADKEAIQSTFEQREKPLIRYPGAAGVFYGNSLERDGFIVIQAPEKAGKSRELIDFAWRGLLQKKRVAFFEVGDMSQNQVMMRMVTRAVKRPLDPCKLLYPTFFTPALNKGNPDITYETREYTKRLEWQEAWESFQKIAKRVGEDGLLRLSCHSNFSISVLGIRSILQDWEREGFVPDVLIIDYADVLALVDGKQEGREQINTTWKYLRGISQSFHCLVISATQSNAASYKVETMDRSNFSEDKRKMAHCTGMVGINVTKGEKRLGISRLNWIVRREAEFDEEVCCHRIGIPAISNPCILSSF